LASAQQTYRLTDLGTLAAVQPGASINDSGQATGYASDEPARRHAFLWDGSTMQTSASHA
jgi:probable HAF family extracellular repeat protein